MAWAAWATAAKSITCLLLTGRRTGCARSRWRLSVSTFSRLFLEAENLGWLGTPSTTLPRGGAAGTAAAEARSARAHTGYEVQRASPRAALADPAVSS